MYYGTCTYIIFCKNDRNYLIFIDRMGKDRNIRCSNAFIKEQRHKQLVASLEEECRIIEESRPSFIRLTVQNNNPLIEFMYPTEPSYRDQCTETELSGNKVDQLTGQFLTVVTLESGRKAIMDIASWTKREVRNFADDFVMTPVHEHTINFTSTITPWEYTGNFAPLTYSGTPLGSARPK